jgi:hypothetical protein
MLDETLRRVLPLSWLGDTEHIFNSKDLDYLNPYSVKLEILTVSFLTIVSVSTLFVCSTSLIRSFHLFQILNIVHLFQILIILLSFL